MIVVGLTGYKRCGKDSAAEVLVNEFGFKKYAFADTLREIASAIDPTICLSGSEYAQYGSGSITYNNLLANVGYEKAKDVPDFRRFLQRLGTEGIRNNFGDNVWVDLLERKLLRDGPEAVVITDCRFFNEAEWVQSCGTLWRVVRPGFGGDDNHASERDIARLPADLELVSSSLDELQENVRKAANNLLKGP